MRKLADDVGTRSRREPGLSTGDDTLETEPEA